MYIVNTINGLLQAMTADPDCPLASWQYEDKPTANVRLDNKMPSPTCLFLQVTDFQMDSNMLTSREKASVNLTFMEKEGKIDAGGLEQDEIIDRMKALATEFIQRLRAFKTIRITNDEIKAKSVFLRSDSNRSGVNIELQLEQRQGECIGSPEPYILEIDENGTYDVAGYAQVVVDIECPEPPVPPTGPGFYIMALENDVQVSMTHYGTNKTTTKPTLYWTRNLQDYYLLNDTVIVLPNIGDKLWFYGDNPNGIGKSTSNYSTFAINGECTVSGDVTTLLDRAGLETLTAPYAFFRLFYGCSSITTAPSLPSTTLSDSCYMQMFYNCASLTEAPELPAETMTNSCYYYMFQNCTSLTTAPELPATTLADRCYNGMFYGCSNLETAPELPVTELADHCYAFMFKGCTSLTTTPELPAETLADYCYDYMFQGCAYLTTVPVLPAETLADHCYAYMFKGCTSLTTTPELPATTLAQSCYYSMFSGCTSLTTAPELPAERMVQSCYGFMFNGCTSLTTAPELPAATLAQACYRNMFEGCTSLTTAPALPSTTLADNCYTYMFNGCSSLNWIKVRITNWNETNCREWVKDVAPTGTFHKLSTLTNIPIDSVNGVPIGWTVVNDDEPPVPPTPPTPTEPDYVSFTAEQAGATIGMVNTNNSPVLYWSTDQTNWTQWDYSNITLTNAGDKIYFYGNNQNGVSGAINSSSFAITGNVAVSGDITTLITREGTDTVPAYCFNALFQNCDITSAPELPATTLGDGCYLSMFKGCTSLTTAPALPATTLATNCYWGMFNGCSSLTTAPALPATTLADGCYYGMFVLCSSLATAPELPATTLVQNCYGSMFNGCPSLQNVTCLATDVSATDCTWEWLNGVSETGTFTKSVDMSSWPTGTSGIPSGWTVINYHE